MMMRRAEANESESTNRQAARTSSAWPQFAERLQSALAGLVEDQYLILSLKGSNQCIQFAAQGFFGMRLETTSNFFMDDAHQLSDEGIARLMGLGWHAPTSDPEHSSPRDDPDGSPNFFIDFPLPLNCKELAGLTVRTFTEVLNVPHPGYLEYEAFRLGGESIPLPMLGLKRVIQSGESEEHGRLSQLLLDTIKELTGIGEWSFDDDGDIGGIRYGSAVTHARLIEDRPYIRFHSLLISNVVDTQRLLVRVNEMNAETGFMHMVVKDGAVLAVSDVLVTPFIASHVAHALGNFSQTAENLHDTLQAEFGDFVSDPQHSPVKH